MTFADADNSDRLDSSFYEIDSNESAESRDPNDIPALEISNLDATDISIKSDQLSDIRSVDVHDNSHTRHIFIDATAHDIHSISIHNNPELEELEIRIGASRTIHSINVYGNHGLSGAFIVIGEYAEINSVNIWKNPSLDLVHLGVGTVAMLESINIWANLQISRVWLDLQALSSIGSANAWNNPKLEDLSLSIEPSALIHGVGLWNNDSLRTLPTDLWQHTNLETLFLGGILDGNFSMEILNLVNLRRLDLRGNRLAEIPTEIEKLTQLEELDLGKNNLSQLPTQISRLVKLRELSLRENVFTFLPPVVAHLENLKQLDLRNNQLTSIPADIARLVSLENLDLSYNDIRHLPPELGSLNLRKIELKENRRLLTPPPEIVLRRTTSILSFLQELQRNKVIRYEAKLLVVGEGGVGKSSLLRALRREEFDPKLLTTHGVEIGQFHVGYPEHPDRQIILNTWDFGGQQIYHATHQLFLTRRSIYLVVWNARLGVEQARLNYWLETIKALAADAPVLLVATHIDERIPDLNYALYKEAYPQIIGHCEISNLDQQGLEQLKVLIAEAAAGLPMMGQPWPKKWLAVEQVLVANPKHHILMSEYVDICLSEGVEADVAQGTLGNYLHDLGKVLYYSDDYVLKNLIVLKPNWITKTISRVLTDEITRSQNGVLSHADLPRIWSRDEDGREYESHLYPVFLRLMERFELSYQIAAEILDDHPMCSLIPQLLPYQPPAGLPSWPESLPTNQSSVEMIYTLPDFVPAGIMSWFIVRTHQYTCNFHWRDGVFLKYEGHQARVELNPVVRQIHLIVWGTYPQTFFTILMNTLDSILARFKNLRVKREVPCICHLLRNSSEPCSHRFRYEVLISRIEARKLTIECDNPPFAEVSVPELLYGIHTSTSAQVMLDIQQQQRVIQTKLEDLQKLDLILERVDQQSELIGREFSRQWNLEMQKMEAECPSTFLLMPGDNSILDPRNWVSQEYRMYLMCQYPAGPHPVGLWYTVRKPEEWWTTVSPWLTFLIKFLKFGIPMGKAIGSVIDENAVKQIQTSIGLLEQISKNLPGLPDVNSLQRAGAESIVGPDQQAVGPALRALCSYLKEVDKKQEWRGLYKTLTPDGNILWLCGEHRKPYEAKPLALPL